MRGGGDFMKMMPPLAIITKYSVIKLNSGVKNFHHLASNFDVTTQGGDIII
jgi:hypothetical protein